MIDFKVIEKTQIEEFRKYIDYSAGLGCELSILNAYLWRNEFNIKFAIIDETLVRAYFKSDGSLWGYCLPTGKNIRGAMDEIFADAMERGQKPYIVLLTTAQRAMLETMYPSKFTYARSPENQDYIYYSKDLATLAGKKFHAKRNHISRFYRKYTDTCFKTLDSSMKQDAMKVVLDWCDENNINKSTYGELEVIKEAIDNFEEFKMSGAVLYVEDRPIAMTLGSEISPKVFDVNFEKALREYDGAYAVINNEFAKTLTKYEYINREEDMGIEGLRKAKLSYNPVIILDRYNAELK